MQIPGHRTIAQTMGVYAKIEGTDLGDAVESLPSMEGIRGVGSADGLANTFANSSCTEGGKTRQPRAPKGQAVRTSKKAARRAMGDE